MKKIGSQFIMMAAILIITGMDSLGQDWPQWRGEQRDGVLKKTDLNLDWTAKKPPLAWTFRQAGSGYSSPTIVGTTLYCQGAEDRKDFAFALDTQTGNLKWKQVLGNSGELQPASDRGAGPRGSVTVDGDKLYLVRSGGLIHCLSAADGKMIWQKDFKTDFNGKMMSDWGFSESPLVDGNLVICTPGGSNGTMVGLDKNTGALVWRSTNWTDDCSYSSPIVAEVGGIRLYIQQASKGVAGVSAKDGKLLWKVDYPTTGRPPSAIIPTPIFYENMVYATNGYNCGSMGIQLVKEGESIKANTIYANSVITNQHGGAVLVNGYVFGFTDPPGSSWICQNLKTGEQVWAQRDNDVSKGAVLAVNDRLLLLAERTGLLSIVAASPDGWKEFGRMDFPERTKLSTQDNMVWAHPVVSNDKLYLRDHDLLFCFDLKK